MGLLHGQNKLSHLPKIKYILKTEVTVTKRRFPNQLYYKYDFQLNTKNFEFFKEFKYKNFN